MDHLRSGCSAHTDGGGDGGQAAAPRHGQVSMTKLEPRATKRQMLNPSSVIFHCIPDMTFADFKPQSVKSYIYAKSSFQKVKHSVESSFKSNFSLP